MMNRAQREQNRQNAAFLERNAHICSNCGERGFHFVGQQTLQDILDGTNGGFWTCPMLYGKDGRRLAD